jgi:hypothetical protein
MKKIALAVSCAFLLFSSVAEAKGGHSYGNQGGHYAGGHGSSHKGGHYKNARTGDHYTHHTK